MSSPGPGTLAPKRSEMPSSGWMRTISRFGIESLTPHLAEQHHGRALELDRDLRHPLRQPLARAEVERHVGPPPVVDLQPHRRERLGRRRRARPSARRGSPAPTAPASDPSAYWPRTTHRSTSSRVYGRIACSTFTRSSRTAFGAERGRRLHRGQREQLEQVVLHHVAQRAGRVVVAAAPLDADGLGHRDLHVVHVAPVPDRLEDAVGEPEDHQVLDGLLPEVVIDAVDLPLVAAPGPAPGSARAPTRGPRRTASRRRRAATGRRPRGRAPRGRGARRSSRSSPAAWPGSRGGCPPCRAWRPRPPACRAASSRSRGRRRCPTRRRAARRTTRAAPAPWAAGSIVSTSASSLSRNSSGGIAARATATSANCLDSNFAVARL